MLIFSEIGISPTTTAKDSTKPSTTTLQTTTAPTTTMSVDSIIFKNSTILTYEQSSDLVKLIGLNNTNVKLLYQASRDGFDNRIFHSKCDGVAGTLAIIKTENSNIFGGYTSADWSGNQQYKSDSTAFLFSLVNGYNVSVKMDIVEGKAAILADSNFGFVFGGGSDFYCDKNECYSNLGLSYKLPNFLTHGSNETKSFLGGSQQFQAVEIEFYNLTFAGIFFFI